MWFEHQGVLTRVEGVSEDRHRQSHDEQGSKRGYPCGRA